MRIQDCSTLAQYRLEVLRETQAAVGRRCRSMQGQIAQIESGKMPQPWNRSRFADAYGISVRQFERMVIGAARAAELRKPLSETHPLLASVMADCPASIERIEANEDWQMWDREAV